MAGVSASTRLDGYDELPASADLPPPLPWPGTHRRDADWSKKRDRLDREVSPDEGKRRHKTLKECKHRDHKHQSHKEKKHKSHKLKSSKSRKEKKHRRDCGDVA
jgi:hypothetical protein